MNEKQAKIAELIENEEFNKKAEGAASTEALVALFAEYGVEVTEEEINDLVASAGAELDESSLEDVSGGVGPAVIGTIAFILWLRSKLRGK